MVDDKKSRDTKKTSRKSTRHSRSSTSSSGSKKPSSAPSKKNWRQSCCSRCIILYFGCALVLVLAVTATALGIRFSDYRKASNIVPTTPGDTRLLSYSPTFCEGVGLSSPTNHTTSVYLLTEEPNLSSQNHLLVSTQRTGLVHIEPWGHHFWHFFLHSDSQLAFKACAILLDKDAHVPPSFDNSVEFLIIRGEGNFHRWRNGDEGVVIDSNNVPTKCLGQLMGNKHILHFAEEFFFVFVNYSPYHALVNTTLDFNRNQFHLNLTDVHSHCDAGGRHRPACTVKVPEGTELYTLVIANDSHGDSVAFADEAFTASWSCQPRSFLYGVWGGGVSGAVLVSVVVFTLAMLLIRQWWRRRTRERKKRRLAMNVETSSFVESDLHVQGFSSPASPLLPGGERSKYT